MTMRAEHDRRLEPDRRIARLDAQKRRDQHQRREHERGPRLAPPAAWPSPRAQQHHGQRDDADFPPVERARTRDMGEASRAFVAALACS